MNKEDFTRERELHKELKEIDFKINKLEKSSTTKQIRKLEELRDTIKEDIDRINIRKLIGKYFKYHNCYSGEGDRWWLYIKIIEDENGDVVAYDFQVDCYGKLSIMADKISYPGRYGDNYIEIPEIEFNEAVKPMIKQVNSLMSYGDENVK